MMIATLTLNPSLDKTVVLEKLVFEDVNRAKQIYIDPGGKGINVSRVISRFGQETVALGFLGGLTGDYVLTLLKEEGVKTDFVPIKGETRTNITLIRNPQSEIEKGGDRE